MVKRLRSARKNIMREFTISELSAVDRPAQAHARMTIMKRADDPDDEDFDKHGEHDQSTHGRGGGGGGSRGGGKGYSEKDFDDEPHVKITTREGLDEWAKEGGWKNGAGFERSTGVTFDEIKGSWFTVAGNRVFLKDYGSTPPAAPSVIAQEIQALDFEAVMAEELARAATQRVKDCVWSKWNALQRSFETIAGDDDVSPADKVTAMKESLQQFLQALADEAEEIAESVTKSITTAVPALAELLTQNGDNQGDAPMTEAEKKQLTALEKSVETLTKQLEAATAKEPAKKAADLQGELDAAKAQVEALTKKLGDAKELVGKAKEEYEEAVAKAGLSDAEKAHMASLEGADKMKFMRATPEERKAMMAKRADADPVIYKGTDGTEFRKSAGDAVIALAKRADASDKTANEEREKREVAELTKRADDFLKSFTGETAAKVDVLRAVSKMDAGPRTALEKMLEAGGKAIAAAFKTIGHSRESLQKTADDFNKRVNAIQERDKCARHEAMTKARAEDPDAYQAYQGASPGGGAN